MMVLVGLRRVILLLADASEHAVVLGFNVRPTGAVKKKSKELGYRYSYLLQLFMTLLDEVKALLGGMMSSCYFRRSHRTGRCSRNISWLEKWEPLQGVRFLMVLSRRGTLKQDLSVMVWWCLREFYIIS